LGFVVDVEVVVPLEIISEEAHTALHRHQLGTPRQGLLFQRGERFSCCLQEALGVNFKQFHAEIDFREVSFVLGAVVGTEADRIPKIIGSKPRHDRVKVDDAKTLAGRFVEQNVVQLGVVVGDAQRQLTRRQQIHHNVILCFAGADKLNFALHLCGTTHAVFGHGALEVSETLGRIVEVRDRLMQGVCRIFSQLMLEIAKCNSALVKILSRLHLLQTDSVLYKFIDTPAATISSLIIGLFLFGRHHMERSTRRVSPALLSLFAQKICNAADVFHQTSRVFECIGIDFLQDVAFCPLPRRYRDGIRLVNMSFAIRNRL